MCQGALGIGFEAEDGNLQMQALRIFAFGVGEGKCMRVIVGCEFSQIVTKAFRDRGHEAYSCDLLPTEGNPDWHFQEDIFEVLDREPQFDLGIFHPPCTFLANAGVQHLAKSAKRWTQMLDGKDFFMQLFNAEIPRIAVENPIPHGYAQLPRYQQIIQPFEHGHEVMKKTCLWLKNLPPLMASCVVNEGPKYIGKDGKSNGSAWFQLMSPKDRGKMRSVTFQGIANAMADQWG